MTEVARDSLFDAMPCGMLVAEPLGAIVIANRTLLHWLDRAGETLDGQRIDVLLTAGSRLFRQTHLLPLLQLQGSVGEVQLELHGAGGHALPVLASVVRVRLADGSEHDRYAFMLARDRRKYEKDLLEARRHAEAALEARREAIASLVAKEAQLRVANYELERAHQRKDEFIAVLGHELRNPLTPLRTGLDLLRLRPPPLDPMLARTLEVFDRQVSFMTHLVEDLMDTARIGQGKLVLVREAIKVGQLVEQACEIAAPRCAKAGQLLQVRQGSDALIHADAFRITQVLANLLTNASKYTPAGGRIEIAHDVEGDDARITVSDNGIGIHPSQLATVFDMFAQAEGAVERAQGGIGIGLALVKGLVQLHGGRVAADSAGPGCGTTFTVLLPLYREPGAAPRTDLVSSTGAPTARSALSGAGADSDPPGP